MTRRPFALFGRRDRGARWMIPAGVMLLAVGVIWWLAQDHAGGAPELLAAPLRRVPEPELAVSFEPVQHEPHALVATHGSASPLAAEAALPGFEVLVVDGNGQAVRGARVRCSAGAAMTALTDAAGWARVSGDPFAGSAEGDVFVTASLICYRATTAPLARSAASPGAGAAESPSVTPMRLVLRRCATLWLELVAGEDVHADDLFILLRSDGRLYDSELPHSETGALGARRRNSRDWFPRLSAAEPGHDPRAPNWKETPFDPAMGEQRLYAFGTDGRCLLVGLQPGRPLIVEVATERGETVFEETLTLTSDEWRELETPVFAPKRDLRVVVRGSDGGAVANPEIVLWFPKQSFASLRNFGMRSGDGGVKFDGLRGEHVGLVIQAEGYAVRELGGITLEKRETTVEVILERRIAGAPLR